MLSSLNVALPYGALVPVDSARVFVVVSERYVVDDLLLQFALGTPLPLTRLVAAVLVAVAVKNLRVDAPSSHATILDGLVAHHLDRRH